MGPIALVDKSFLQALNEDQMKAFHKHYSILVTPILLEEILGNLVKSKFSPDKALRRVISLAVRANSMSGFSISDFRGICIADLKGHKIPMNGQIPAFGAKEVTASDGSKVIVLDESHEKKILRNWASGKFSEEDKQHAGKLIKEFEEYELLGSQKEMQLKFPENMKYASLEEIKEKINRIVETQDNWQLIETHAKYCLATNDDLAKIKDRWEGLGRPRFDSFAPYAFYTWKIAGIYFLGITAGLIKAGNRAKTLIDIIYFYYLPFCHVFISKDNFHKEFFPLAARDDQSFLWGDTLNADLNQIASFHISLNDKDRIEFEKEFGSYPPPIIGSNTKEMWEKYMRPWTSGSGNRAAGRSAEENRKIAEELFRNLGLKKEDN